MSDPIKHEMYARPSGEAFDVVLLKKGVSPFEAKTEDFKRLSIVASSPTDAGQDPRVAAETEHVLVQSVNPAALTEYEQMARAREQQSAMGTIDRTKV